MHSASASSYPGAPTDFVEKIRNFSHTAWVQTALLPDPRQHDPPAASPGIIRWGLHPHDVRLFAGTGCGDASCTLGGARPERSARAAWAVCEVNEHFKNRRLCIHRTAAGTLPGPAQSAEGTELFALVFWLRHLDPSSPAVPRFVTDCERVYDGWHGRWDTTDAWTPHLELWQDLHWLRRDCRDDVEVHWIPGHARPEAQSSRGPLGRLGWFGNAAAHTRARDAVTWHPAATSGVAVARTEAFALHLSIAYARLLQWAVDEEGRLPEATPLECIFRPPRPPPLPAHEFAADREGCERCVRCLLPQVLAQERPCRPHGALGHALFAHGAGIFCGRCGAYSFQRLELLGSVCTGPPPPNGPTAWRRRRMLDGWHPTKTRAWLGVPTRVDPAIETFSIVLGDSAGPPDKF